MKFALLGPIWVAVACQELKAGCAHVLYFNCHSLVDLWLFGKWELCPLRRIRNLCYISFSLGGTERCCNKVVLHIGFFEAEASYHTLCSKREEH